MTFVRAIRQNRPRWMVIAALMALVASLLVSQFGAANAAATRSAGAATTQSGAKPTIVLVHGAWADSGSWDGVVARLQAGGYTVTAPPNPLRGLPDDAAYLAAFLASVPGPMVVVGHSYGGAVITNAATGNPNVTTLVYVDAFIPAQDETLLQLVSAQPGSCVGETPSRPSTWCPIPAPRRALSTPTSSRAWSPPASPTTCRPAPQRSWPPPSAHCRPPPSPSRPDRPPGSPSRPGRWSAPPTRLIVAAARGSS